MNTSSAISEPTRYDLEGNETASGTLVFYDDWKEVMDALKQAESRAASAEKDARRYRLCQQEGFPVRNQSPADENKRWTIQGKWYGATPSLCIDAASGEAG